MRIFARDASFPETASRELAVRLPAMFADKSSTLNHRNGQQTMSSEVNGIPVIVKRYIDANHGIERLRPRWLSRAFRSYRLAARLHACSVPTARPLLLAGSGRDLITVSEKLSANELYLKMRESGWLALREEKIAEGISDLMKTMGAHRVTHGDLHSRNLLVNDDGKLWLIDLDGLQFHRSAFGYARRRGRDEHRLGKSLYHGSPELAREAGFEQQGESWRWRDKHPHK